MTCKPYELQSFFLATIYVKDDIFPSMEWPWNVLNQWKACLNKLTVEEGEM